ncbi:PAS domain-containing protein [Candidatus Saccharibacteria bacterium]|nr:PAS domain-containing protein [Candidatus Saccharibacteria bacterium]
MAAGVVLLYFLPSFSDAPIGQSFIVNVPVLVIASLTTLISIVSYLWIPKKAVLAASLVVYFLLAITVAGLITTSGGSLSPFIALWMLVAIFAGVFGIWGLIPALLAVGVFVATEYLKGRLTVELGVVVVFTGLIPLIVSLIIWHSKSSEDGGGDRAYKDLANELSQVATQSEVVINAIGDGVISINNKGIVQLINPAAQRIIGWGKQDALALSYKSVLQLTNQKGEPLDITIDPIQQVLNTNQQVRSNDFVIATRNEKKVMASLVISPISGVGSGAIIVFRDITKEKTEERGQAEFISTASHEMRTPVASIEGYLGLALNPQTAQVDEKARDFIMKAHESAQHLGSLLKDLLDVSKAEDGRLSNNPKVVDVMAYVHDIIQGLQQKAADKGLRLIFKPIPDDDERHLSPVYNVNLDNDHIREVVNNLTENAIKYTLKGEVIVDVTGSDDKIIISVQDTGIGIPTEDMPHLFQKFYRVDNADTRQIGGTGLGLYLCRRLAEAMGGRIWAESEYKKGSTFYLALPRIDNAEATRLVEQQALDAQAAADKAATQSTETAIFTPTPIDSQPQPQTVPRGESLTPEQIAAHVVKLQALAQEQSATTQPTASVAAPPNTPLTSIEQNPAAYTQPVPTRPPSVSIPVRDISQPPQ